MCCMKEYSNLSKSNPEHINNYTEGGKLQKTVWLHIIKAYNNIKK